MRVWFRVRVWGWGFGFLELFGSRLEEFRYYGI